MAAPFFDKFDTELLHYADLAVAIDPHVLPEDPAFVREIDWKLPDNQRPLRRRAVAADGGNAPAPADNVISNASTAEQRIENSTTDQRLLDWPRMRAFGEGLLRPGCLCGSSSRKERDR